MRTTVAYWLSNSDGHPITILGRLPSSERWASITNTVSGSSPLPLGRQPVIAVGSTQAYVGLADSFAIDVFSLDGRRTGTIRRDAPLRPTTAEDIEHFKLVDSLGRSVADNMQKVEEWKTMQFSSTLPPYAAMIVDVADHLWVKIFPDSKEVRATWVIFAADGSEQGTIELSRDFQINEVGVDYVLGIETDTQTGIKRVKSFPLTRPKP
ncbi:MAG TPA: hypothetical protein VGE27_15395 [Gemmatimonas sp.]|uniref:hypothetical protein n=1 Tax=Gemmatimonas sp. TaxID=1962908 RepID=UPI002ED83159